MPSRTDAVHVELLGRFRVRHAGRHADADDFPARRARELVALLALADGRRLPRERVLEELWPHLDPNAGAANLRKAAHHARRTLGDDDAVKLRGGMVELFPDQVVTTDVDAFLAAAADALADGDPERCLAVAATCPGQVLPDALYETWTQGPRGHVQERLAELLRRSGDHEKLLEAEPTDEGACRALMRAAIDGGRPHAAIRWYEQLRVALARELGARPSAATRALYDECTAGLRPGDAPFVGRGLELAEAMAALGRARDSKGTAAILMRGTAGIGKSALAREVADRATAGGWRVLTTASVATGAPFGPIAAALEQLLVGDRPAFEALPERTRSVLSELTPLAGPAAALQSPLTRHQVIAALRRALALDADLPPTVLLVEDAHLADEASADVLHQLVAAGVGHPFVVLATYRSEWMRTSLPQGLDELARATQATTLHVGPLSDGEIAQLVTASPSASLGAADVAYITSTAEGSPFFALELARGIARGAVPRTVREAVAAPFLALEAATLDTLAKLAIADGDFDLATVLALTGLDDEAAFALLDEALEDGVLVVEGTHYRFRHELVRQALTDDLPAHRRLMLHRDAAQRLVAAGGAAEAIAHHFVRGEQRDEATPWLLRAARHAIALGAYADALAQVERLLSTSPDHPDGLRMRAEVLDALGDVRAPDAYAAAARAIGDPDAQDLIARQALAQLKASEPVLALSTLERCRPRTTVGRLAEALTLSAAAAIGVYGDADTATAKAEEAHRLALDLGEPGAILDATWAHALAAHAKGELPARLRTYLRATSELPEIATRVFDGQLCVTERMLYGGLPGEEIIEFASRLAAEAERLGAARGHAFALTLRGEAEVLAARLDEADKDFEAGARLHGRIGAVAGEALSLLGRAHVAIARGRPEQARPHLATALLLARESEVGHHTLDRIYGAMVEAAEDPPAAVDLIREAETAIQGPAETCPTCRIAFVVPAAVAAARAGDVDRARRYAEDCERALEIIALPPAWHAAGDEVRGWLARAEGRSDDARAHFGSAAQGFHAWGQPLDATRCELLAAQTA